MTNPIICYDELTDFQKKVFDMMELQLQEDSLVHIQRNTSYKEIMKNNGYFYALLDEIGELNHELKPQWCWWKQTVGEVDRAKMIEEFSDVTHFILSFHLACYDGNIIEAFDMVPSTEHAIGDAERYIDPYNPIQWIITELLDIVAENVDNDSWRGLFGYWITLYKLLGLDFVEDVYKPYISKNAVNQQRMNEGY